MVQLEIKSRTVTSDLNWIRCITDHHISESLMSTYFDSATLQKPNLNILAVQMQDHVVQEADIFTPSFLENSMNPDVWDIIRSHEIVSTAVRDGVNSASEIDDGGAGQGAHGVEGTTGGVDTGA